MTIVYASAARKALKHLDATTRNRIIGRIDGLAKIPPDGDIKPLKGTNGLYRLRVGVWRIVFSYPERNTALIERVAPRGEVYKGR